MAAPSQPLGDEEVAPSLKSNIIVVKGRQDLILCAEGHSTVTGGHSRATVAGTGDVLAGIAAALYAQSKDIRGATLAACTVAKRAAVKLGEKHHFGFLASEFIDVLPDVLKELKIFRITKHQSIKSSLTDRFRKA